MVEKQKIQIILDIVKIEVISTHSKFQEKLLSTSGSMSQWKLSMGVSMLN